MKNPTPVAVASRSFSRHAGLREQISLLYENVKFNIEDRALAGDELVAFLAGYPMALVGLEPLDETVLARLPELEVVAKYGVGLDGLDLRALERRGIRLGWQGGVNRRCVAELTLSFLLALSHLTPAAHRCVREGAWKPFRGHDLTGRIVGIIGCGHVGKELVLLLEPFRCRVLVNDIRDYSEFYAAHAITPAGLDELLRVSDAVTLHVPLDPSTRNLLDASRLAMMKPGAILVNAARGGLVDEAALARLLASGHLAGAAFDVFATEPPTDRTLIDLPNFLCTPHIGGASEEAVLAMGRTAIENLGRAALPSVVVPELLTDDAR